MAFVARLFAVQAVISAGVTISGDDGEAPVRRMAKAVVETDDAPPVRRSGSGRGEPLSLAEKVTDGTEDSFKGSWVDEFLLNTDDDTLEIVDVTKLDKDWPHCQVFRKHNWNTNGVSAEQSLKKFRHTLNVSSAQACGNMCGSYAHPHGNVKVPCAGWTWVENPSATEHHGHKSCALYGFVRNEPGVLRHPVADYVYDNACCIAGTPCKHGESISEYDAKKDGVANAFNTASRERLHKDRKAKHAAAHRAQMEHHFGEQRRERERKKTETENAAAWRYQVITTVLKIAAVLSVAIGVAGGIWAWQLSKKGLRPQYEVDAVTSS